MPIMHPDGTTPTVITGLKGRSIVHMLLAVLRFWGHHRDTLAPQMDARLVAALDTLADAVLLIQLLDPPGPY